MKRFYIHIIADIADWIINSTTLLPQMMTLFTVFTAKYVLQ